MFNFFRRRRQPQKTFTIIARYSGGHWFRQFEVKGVNAYEACRSFDVSEEGLYWYRISGATLTNEV